jgi:hypothetical protein
MQLPTSNSANLSVAANCDPVEQQARQDELDRLYAEDGRHDPKHPDHGTYTNLVFGAKDAMAAQLTAGLSPLVEGAAQ